MKKLRWLLLLCVLAFVQAHAALTIEITGGSAAQIPVAIVPFGAESVYSDRLSAIISADLQRSGLFKLIDTSGTSQPHLPAEVRAAEWKARGAEALAIGNIAARPDGKLDVQFRLLDVVRQNQLESQLAGHSMLITPAQLRITAHQIADIIYEKLTGDAGVFATRIAYVTKRGPIYELQVSDADGYGALTLLTSREPVISPAWSPDGARLAYVSFEKQKPAVFVQSLASGQRYVLANFKGNNSAPAWSPDGTQLAIVLTRDGGSQLYLINADGSGVKRLTHSSGIDTEPCFSPDGKYILFTSDRGGSPQIYRIPSYGGEAVRLTFEGSYNVTPRYSPDGKSFTFIRREDSAFRVAVQDIASGQVQVLTDSALDESPSFAPNGKIILYATAIGGRGVLAAVSSDGRVKQRLTTQSGDVREPAWGPLLKTQSR